MTLLRDKLFTSVALSHLMVDVLNAQRPVLLAYLSGPLGLTNSFLGLVSTIYLLGTAMVQPVFGYLADRFGVRWMIAGGVFWMAGFFGLAVTVPGNLALVFLVVASFGSAAVHPAGAMQATLQGQKSKNGRETTAASFFFLFGQLGFFLGPLLGGPILDMWGPIGLLGLVLFSLPIGSLAAWQLPGKIEVKSSPPAKDEVQRSQALKINFGLAVLLALLAISQAWASQNIVTFLPKYLSDLGKSPSTYGFLAAIYMAGSAAGNLLGGNLSDRYGKRTVILTSMSIIIIPFFILARIGYSPWLNIIIPVIGLLNGASYIAIVVLAQRMIPGGMALASGLILGFIFSAGALGTVLSGIVADRWGFPPVYDLTAGIALLGAVVALFLKPDQVLVPVMDLEESFPAQPAKEISQHK